MKGQRKTGTGLRTRNGTRAKKKDSGAGRKEKDKPRRRDKMKDGGREGGREGKSARLIWGLGHG